MRKFVLTLKVLGWTGGVIAVGLLIGGFMTRTPTDLIGITTRTSPVSETPAASAKDTNRIQVNEVPGSTVQAHAVPPPIQSYETSEDSFEQILSLELPTEEKARRLLDLFPGLNPDAQADAALLACQLVPDRDYSLLGKYLTDGGTTAPAREILLANLLERPTSVKVPWLQEMARDPQNPDAMDAEALLGLVQEEESAQP